MALATFDFQAHDTFFVVAHMHYVLFGTVGFAMFGGIFYWFPKMTGQMLDERLGKLQFWLLILAFNATFFPMHQVGAEGMPRRVGDYPPTSGWTDLNLLATAGSAIFVLAIGVFVWNVVTSLRVGPPAGDDPWGGHTLEWATSSPPPHHNFRRMPPIHSERPVLDERLHVLEERQGGEVVEPPPSRTQVERERRE